MSNKSFMDKFKSYYESTHNNVRPNSVMVYVIEYGIGHKRQWVCKQLEHLEKSTIDHTKLYNGLSCKILKVHSMAIGLAYVRQLYYQKSINRSTCISNSPKFSFDKWQAVKNSESYKLYRNKHYVKDYNSVPVYTIKDSKPDITNSPL